MAANLEGNEQQEVQEQEGTTEKQRLPIEHFIIGKTLRFATEVPVFQVDPGGASPASYLKLVIYNNKITAVVDRKYEGPFVYARIANGAFKHLEYDKKKEWYVAPGKYFNVERRLNKGGVLVSIWDSVITDANALAEATLS